MLVCLISAVAVRTMESASPLNGGSSLSRSRRRTAAGRINYALLQETGIKVGDSLDEKTRAQAIANAKLEEQIFDQPAQTDHLAAASARAEASVRAYQLKRDQH